MEKDDDTPIWGRVAIALIVLGFGAAMGGLIGGSWSDALVGTLVAVPFAAIGFLWPAGMVGLLALLELFSCLG